MSKENKNSIIHYTYNAQISRTLEYAIPEDVLEEAIEEALKEGAINARQEFFQEVLIHSYIDLEKYPSKTVKLLEDDIEVISIKEK